MNKQIIIDGHNDLLWKLESARRVGNPLNFFEPQDELDIDAIKAKQGGFCGGLFALFTSNISLGNEDLPVGDRPIDNYNHLDALNRVSGMMAEAHRLVRESDGYVVICRSSTELNTAAEAGKMGIMLHIEGCEAIDRDFNSLEMLYAAGLRSLGPLWSRDNIYGVGVPFEFPRHPDIGDGLSDIGIELVKICNQMNIMVDLSHLNEKGFWDIAKYSDKPLMVSHSNIYELSKSPRNLTDKQLAAVAESQGIVGLNFESGYLNSDGKAGGHASLDIMLKHIEYMLEKLGENGVALGSDFDGAPILSEVASAADLPNLVNRFKEAGYSAELIDKICYKNWISFMQRSGI